MALSFHEFLFTYPGDNIAYPLEITVYAQPTDRYTALKGVGLSAVIEISSQQLPILPVDYDGFVVERSNDRGQTWGTASGIVRNSFLFVDSLPAPGTYQYRAKMRTVSGKYSDPGTPVEIAVGQWNDEDELGISEIDVATGTILNRLPRPTAFPKGFEGEAHEGMSISEGSLAGGYGLGAWYIRTQEVESPIVYNHSPACGTPNVLLPLTVITFKIQDQPYPVGGSAIDDSKTIIWLSVSSQYNNALLKIRDGATQPQAPTITCAIAPGVDPLKDRDVTITVPAGYIQQSDTVVVKTYAEDTDGNYTIHTCSFAMEVRDDIPPTITNEEPICGTGIDPNDPLRAPRNTVFSFSVDDSDSGVDLTTLDVYWGPSTTGPWTQVLNNGVTWMNGFYGTVISNGGTGYNVTVNRSVLDPLWPKNSQICFRVLVADNEGNLAEEVCCFRTEDDAGIARVIPVSEDLLLVEFSVPMKNSQWLAQPQFYHITSPNPAIAPPVVKQVVPHQFSEYFDPEKPQTRLGDGDPRFVYLNTTPHDMWEQYELTISGNAITDRYGLPLALTSRSGVYRGKKTKVDDHRNLLEDPATQTDSVTRNVMIALGHSDELIGGSFISDDYEDD